MKSSNFAAFCLILVFAHAAPAGKTETANGPVYKGVAVAIDLPPDMAVKNVAGTDGAGLCVWASLQMAANYQNIHELRGLFEYMKRQPGGGWPERVTQVLGKLAPNLVVVQYEGDDPEPIIEAAIASGRPYCVTYGTGEFYSMQPISHMVFGAHLDSRYGAIVDNNDHKHDTWMARQELIRRAKLTGGKAWVVVLLAPPPPPVPIN